MNSFPVKVTLEDTQTKERTLFYTDGYEDEETGEFSEFIWSEGNFSCDCNRARFFHEALNRLRPRSYECGQTRYRVVCITNAQGTVLYEEG
jgi:hypothetical protein